VIVVSKSDRSARNRQYLRGEAATGLSVAAVLLLMSASEAFSEDAKQSSPESCRLFEATGNLPESFQEIATGVFSVKSSDTKVGKVLMDKNWYSNGSCVCSNLLPSVDDNALPGHDSKIIAGANFSCVTEPDYVASVAKRGLN
jgi:hypothetical protein